MGKHYGKWNGENTDVHSKHYRKPENRRIISKGKVNEQEHF